MKGFQGFRFGSFIKAQKTMRNLAGICVGLLNTKLSAKLPR